ncbi:tripartite motif-containing protein 35-like [Denticeps clupeoides]|uniref:B30.2/SPRY domain-containing protein n=1 Tax=Denticeps clupeoides TaxID=299321 RepID=A0AAY4BM18_9TELE|nr:tripartite motif-containing protein 35-like [Denticeps clupeoides]
MRRAGGPRPGRCHLHWQELQFHCETDRQLICWQCRRSGHRGHQVQPIQQAVRKCKEAMKNTMKPLRQRLRTLTKPDSNKRTTECAQKAEAQVKKEFQRLFQFLRDEEMARVGALKEEWESKSSEMKERMDGELSFLTDQVKELEEELVGRDDVTFLQDFDCIRKRVASLPSLPSPVGQEIPDFSDMAKHLGNLKFKVWKKMITVCPYSPVILNPASVAVGVSVSEDLVRLRVPECPVRHRCPGHHSVVIGTRGFTEGVHSWDVFVGNSTEWMLGVTSWKKDLEGPFSMCPENGFWGVQLCGSDYYTLSNSKKRLRVKKTPQKIRVQIGWSVGLRGLCRKVTLSDASNGAVISSSSGISSTGPLFPFCCPMEHSSEMRIMPAAVSIRLKEDPGFLEQHGLTLFTLLLAAVFSVYSLYYME